MAMSNDVVSGQCLCGRLAIRVSGSPRFSVICFCQDCQRISGGGHLPQAAFAKEQVELSGATKVFNWHSDAGNDLSLIFCPSCGSSIYKTTSKMPEMVFLAIGLLDDQSLFEAPHHAFIDSCQHWDRMRNLPSV